MSVLFASSELSPYAKTGGLGDVLAALPPVLRQNGRSVSCVLPLYRGMLNQLKGVQPSAISFQVRLGDAPCLCRIWTAATADGVRLFLVQRDEFFDRSHLYGAEGNYADNAARFIFFSKAVVELAKYIQPLPQIIHAHDWQTGLIPALVRAQNLPFRTVFTIHNLAYQGDFWGVDFGLTNLPGEYFSPPGVEFYGRLNFMKAGIVLAHQVTTVSPRYAEEIQTDRYGCGLQNVLREQRHKLTGILNGVDYETWNPQTDPFLAETYNAAKLKGKTSCKSAALAAMHLPESDAPLFTCISRLASQKGIDLIAGVVEDLLRAGANFLLLGSGDTWWQEHFTQLARRFPQQVGVKIGFSEKLAHQLEAGADFFLMPSYYEPCGLSQLYSLRYGTLPIVHFTGGLADSVQDYEEATDSGTGFVFHSYDASAFLAACERALRVYPNKGEMLKLRRRAMKAEFSWERSAVAYEEVYRRALAD